MSDYAMWMHPTEAQQDGWNEWVQSRPERVRLVALGLNPWTLYWLGDKKVVLHSVDDPFDQTLPVTIKVDVLEKYNGPLCMERRVFGILPSDLRPVEAD